MKEENLQLKKIVQSLLAVLHDKMIISEKDFTMICNGMQKEQLIPERVDMNTLSLQSVDIMPKLHAPIGKSRIEPIQMQNRDIKSLEKE